MDGPEAPHSRIKRCQKSPRKLGEEASTRAEWPSWLGREGRARAGVTRRAVRRASAGRVRGVDMKSSNEGRSTVGGRAAVVCLSKKRCHNHTTQ
jgi:hypothetical protein